MKNNRILSKYYVNDFFFIQDFKKLNIEYYKNLESYVQYYNSVINVYHNGVSEVISYPKRIVEFEAYRISKQYSNKWYLAKFNEVNFYNYKNNLYLDPYAVYWDKSVLELQIKNFANLNYLENKSFFSSRRMKKKSFILNGYLFKVSSKVKNIKSIIKKHIILRLFRVCKRNKKSLLFIFFYYLFFISVIINYSTFKKYI